MTVYSALLPSFGSGMCVHTFNGGRGFLSDRDVNGTLICARFFNSKCKSRSNTIYKYYMFNIHWYRTI